MYNPLRSNLWVLRVVPRVLATQNPPTASAMDNFYEQLLGSCLELGFGLDFDFLEMLTRELSELEVPFTEEVCVCVCVWGGVIRS
jgi:hypothetical protein